MSTEAPIKTLSQNGELIAAGRALGGPIQVSGYCPGVLAPDGYQFLPLPIADPFPLPPLLHIVQRIIAHDAASFVGYVKKFRTPTTILFASPVDLGAIKTGNSGGANIAALLDYHEAPPKEAPKGEENGKAARNAHRIDYPLPLSVEMADWLAKNEERMDQRTFCEFIDRNCSDVVNPSSAALTELSLNFQSQTTVKYSSKINRTTNTTQLQFVEEQESGASAPGKSDVIAVPGVLEINIPVFEGGAPYTFIARMVWDPRGGALKISYVLQRPHVVFRKAIEDVRANIAAALGLEILTGTPK